MGEIQTNTQQYKPFVYNDPMPPAPALGLWVAPQRGQARKRCLHM